VEIAWVYPADGYCGQHTDILNVSGDCGCPKNSYVNLYYTDNQVKIYKAGELIHDTGFVDPPGPDVNIPISGASGEVVIECYNLPKNESYGPWGIKYKVVIGGQTVYEADTGGSGYELVYTKKIECGY
jgi:hypothetical protein